MFVKKNSKLIVVAVFLAIAILSFMFIYKEQKIKMNSIEFSGDDMIILQSIYPGMDEDQLNVYEAIANSDDSVIAKCFSAQDKFGCLTSMALLKQDKNYCHYHSTEAENREAEKFEKDCFKAVLIKTAKQEISQCQNSDGDDFLNCLNAVFGHYDKPEDCFGLASDEKTICEEMLNYNAAYSVYDRSLCDNVKNEKIKNLCLKNIIAKDQDTDGDGLTDLDEINIYKTRHTFADTDNDRLSDGDEINIHKTDPLKFDTDDDGYGDGQEVEAGYNPLVK